MLSSQRNPPSFPNVLFQFATFPPSSSVAASSLALSRILESTSRGGDREGRHSRARASSLRHRSSTSPVNGVEGADGGEGGSFYMAGYRCMRREDRGRWRRAKETAGGARDTFVSTGGWPRWTTTRRRERRASQFRVCFCVCISI